MEEHRYRCTKWKHIYIICKKNFQFITDSARGSNESLASNASIPLPIPVRTRSATGGPGLDSADYNALSIRRLERDTSVDRLSTGSKESNMSTQSEWIGGEKKKKTGLIG